MYTPSLGRRVVVSGIAVVTLLGLGLDALVYVCLRSSLAAGLARELDHDAEIVRHEALHGTTATLPERLSGFGVEALVRAPAGNLVAGPPFTFSDPPVATRVISLPNGATAELAVSREGEDRTLNRLLWLEGFATPLLLALALLLLRLIAEVALTPLDKISAAARRTAGGMRGERLHPQPASTRLGQMASAYDQMLDALEAAVDEAEAARAESDRLLERNRRILDTAQEAFVAVDHTGVVIDWNDEAERIFGWSAAEVIGRPVAGTILPPGPAAEHDNGLERFHTGGAQVRDRVVGFTALHRDGHRFPARMTVWTTAHGRIETVSAFVWDVTKQLQVEKALAQLAAVVESADEAMLSTDLDGTILTWNAAAERMYGWQAHEATGRGIDLIVPDALRAEAAMSLEAVRRGEGVQRIDSIRRCRNGTLVEVALTISPLHDAVGAVCGTSSIDRDVTEEHWMASQLDSSLRALEEALEEARASEADTRRFLDDASHQLRTPITSIRACAEGLLRTNDAGVRDELLGAIVRETARAGRLMTGLLRLARLNHGQQPEPAACDLEALCRDEAERTAALAPHLRVEVTAGPREAGWPRLDAHAVSEIVSNLLDNARRHAETRIDVTVGRDEGWVEITVTDDGAGLPVDRAHTAFDRFVSLDGRGGSGLGLPIARELARAHGGDLTYEHKTFLVRLPATVDDHARDPFALQGGRTGGTRRP